jgi:hypothetical protein
MLRWEEKLDIRKVGVVLRPDQTHEVPTHGFIPLTRSAAHNPHIGLYLCRIPSRALHKRVSGMHQHIASWWFGSFSHSQSQHSSAYRYLFKHKLRSSLCTQLTNELYKANIRPFEQELNIKSGDNPGSSVCGESFSRGEGLEMTSRGVCRDPSTASSKSGKPKLVADGDQRPRSPIRSQSA